MHATTSDTEPQNVVFAELSDGFSERLTSAFERTGLTQKEFAKKAGLDDGVLRTYLSGRSKPHLDKLVSMAITADVDLGWLATGRGEMHGHSSASTKDSPSFAANSVAANLKPSDPRSVREWVRCRADMFAESWVRVSEATKHLPDNMRPTNTELWLMAKSAVDGAFE